MQARRKNNSCGFIHRYINLYECLACIYFIDINGVKVWEREVAGIAASFASPPFSGQRDINFLIFDRSCRLKWGSFLGT